MTSKEALNHLRNFLGESPYQKEINIIKQDLERLERVENAIQEAQLKHFSREDSKFYIAGYDAAVEDIAEALNTPK